MLVERLNRCNHIEGNATEDDQLKQLFLTCWGIEVPRLAFVDKAIAAELILQNVNTFDQILEALG